MPMYEYRCENCGKRFETLQKFSDPPLTVHEECGGGPVERLISPPAFQFKGSGWYVTDYAKGNGSGSKPDSKGDEKTESKSGGKTESKSEGKAEAPAAKEGSSSSSSKPDSAPAPSKS